MSPRVALFFLGGTISMTPGSDGGARPSLDADDLLAAVPGLATTGIALTSETIAREQSGSLTFDHLLEVLERARHSDADGFVLVQGTDTLEESIYTIDLLWDDDRPFVATGAMRNPAMAGADGAANLLAAVQVASSPQARGLGGLLVFADEIHAARFVTKADTASVRAFVSTGAGPIGRVLEGRVHVLSRPERVPALSAPARPDAEVPIVFVGLGQSERTFTTATAGADAIVVAGLGAGHVPGWWAEAVGAAAARVPVVMTSRTSSGPVLLETYGAVGAEIDLQRRGVVMGGYLSPQHARVLVCLALAAGLERAQIEEQVRLRGLYR